MKLLIKLTDYQEIWGSGNRRYRITVRVKAWANLGGLDYSGKIEVFTDNGWEAVLETDEDHKHLLPRKYSGAEKLSEEKSYKSFKSKMVEFAVMFHDGDF